MAMLRVLKSISLYFPGVGYTQGMNFLIAFLLVISGGKDEEAFWSFVFLGKNLHYQILGFFEDGFPLAFFYVYMFEQVLQRENKKLAEHLESLELPNETWIFQWVTTIFLSAFPLEFAVKVWDLVFCKNLFFIIQVAVAIILQFQSNIFEFDGMELLLFFRDLKENNDNVYEDYR